MASLTAFFELIGPSVAAPPAVDWREVENDLGLRLPSDYREMCEKYRPLRFDNFLGTLHPAVEMPAPNLKEWVSDILGAARELREEFPELTPYPLYPEPGGVFPWGVTDNADHLFWRTSGAPDEWPVIVAARDYGDDDWWEFAGGMSSFLVGVMNKSIRCPVLARGFPSENPVVTQYAE